jgi:hypothetical protein
MGKIFKYFRGADLWIFKKIAYMEAIMGLFGSLRHYV